MPASLALVKTYWQGAARQRAVSLWSIGSWGGSGLVLALRRAGRAEPRLALHLLRVRVVAAVGLLLMRGTPESRVESHGRYKFDFAGRRLHRRDGRPADRPHPGE